MHIIWKSEVNLINAFWVINFESSCWMKTTRKPSNIRDGRRFFFRLPLRSCSKIFESWSGSGNFSNLRIRFLFRLRYHRSNREFTLVLLKKWPSRLLLLPKLKNDSGCGSGLSQIFDSGPGSGSERKTQNPAGVDSGTLIPWPLLFSTSWIIAWHSRRNEGVNDSD